MLEIGIGVETVMVHHAIHSAGLYRKVQTCQKIRRERYLVLKYYACMCSWLLGNLSFFSIFPPFINY